MQEEKNEKLKNREDFIQALIDASPGIICMLDDNGRFIAWNSCMRDEIICKSDSEIAGSDAITIVHPDDRALIEKKIQHVLREGIEEFAEVRILSCGGAKFRWFLLKAKRLIIDGNPFLMATGADIDDRKRAEYALDLSEKKFRSITEQLDGVVFICDKEGMFTYVSPLAEKVSGFTPQEMIGHQFTEFLAEKDSSKTLEGFFETLTDSSVKTVFEHRLKRKNGSIFWGESHVQKYQNEENCGTIGLLLDITRRKQFESLELFRQRILQMAESNLAEEILRVTLDEAEKLTESTIGFCHLIKEDPVSPSLWVASSNIQKTMHGVDGDLLHPPLADAGLWSGTIPQQAVITNDYSVRENKRIWWPDGHPEIRRTLLVPMLQGGKVMAILGVGNKQDDYDDHDLNLIRTLADVAWDIVSRKHAELRTHEMQEALTLSQKMDLVGQLAGGIAHDFNNMLGVILGNIEMALDQAPALDDSLHYNLKNILVAANRSAELTRQLLAFARKETVMPIVVELNALIEKMLAVLRQLIGENITIIWMPDTLPALVKADPSQLDQILVNLCVNARDAITNVGSIAIEIGKSCDHKTFDTPHHFCKVPGDYVTLSVTDTGKGIEKEYLPHIFEPFFTTKKKGKGTGMGLSTVYGIVKQNQGCIECRSEVGVGTTFKIHLPRYKEEVLVEVELEKQSLSADHSNKETILIVEDEPEILVLCKDELENKGYRVFTAASPHEAISLVEESEGAVKLLLTDVVMPGLNGCDLFKKLQQLNPSLKVVFMSGYSSDIVAHNNLLDEGINFIQKPFSLKSLSRMVQNMLN